MSSSERPEQAARSPLFGDAQLPGVVEPSLVRAARTHLTSRFASGVAKLMWEEHKAPLSDIEAATAAMNAAQAGEAAEPDIVAALVAIHAARLDLDQLEHRLWKIADQQGLSAGQITAVLNFPSQQHAHRYRAWLDHRATLPADHAAQPPTGTAVERAEQAATRARDARSRAEAAGARADRARHDRQRTIDQYDDLIHRSYANPTDAQDDQDEGELEKG